jgi:imidazoleglycerol phosphate synthase glutamine amidotransferase subunit HisH
MLGTYSPQTISLTPALGWNNYYERSNLKQKELAKKGVIFLILSYHVSKTENYIFTKQ